MASSPAPRKVLQRAAMRLLRSPSDRPGPLQRQRCTSKLRKWTSRSPPPPSAAAQHSDQPQHHYGGDHRLQHVGGEAEPDMRFMAFGSGAQADFRAHAQACPDLRVPASSSSEAPCALNPDQRDGGDAAVGSARAWPAAGLSLQQRPAAAASQAHMVWRQSRFGHFFSVDWTLLANERDQRRGWHSIARDYSGWRPPGFCLEDVRWSCDRGFPRRQLSAAAVEADGDQSSTDGPSGDKECISVTFINRDGSEKSVQVPLGTHMLQAAHDNDIDLEGACEASLACSTCHLIFEDEALYEKLPEPSEEENDMLDLAFGLTSTSRLGCQILATPDLDGARLIIPSAGGNVANFNLDKLSSSVPKSH